MSRVVILVVGGVAAITALGAYLSRYFEERTRRQRQRFDHRLPWEKDDKS